MAQASAAARYHVVGIGNAIVDIIATVEESFVAAQGLAKGAMTLIDVGRVGDLYAAMGQGREVSGGSAGNTVAGLASLGGTAAFIGKVRDDALGRIFRHDINAIGVAFTTDAALDGPPTAQCLILVTPDAQRTMSTFLGASVELGPEDVDQNMVEGAEVTYLEGYLYDPPRAQEAFHKAAEIAHKAGRKVALSLSDPFCVMRHRTEFHTLLEGHIDILFANEAEILSLYETEDMERALAAVRAPGRVAAVTLGAQGSIVVAEGEVYRVAAMPVPQVVDTTGAGDLYASGFLYGVTHGFSLPDAGRLASAAAGAIIAQYGARPERPLAHLVGQLRS